MIDWTGVQALPAKSGVVASLRKMITKANYGFEPGQWNMTALIQDEDTRKYHAYQVIEGIDEELKMNALRSLRMDFRLKVLSRQACCRDKDGHKIWERKQALDNLGMPGDFIVEYDDLPQQGDVVEWKGTVKVGDENGKPIDGKTIKRWAVQGIRPENYEEWIVDSEGCISVHYPFVLSMLSRKGHRLAFPQFRKIDKASKSKRKMTHWYFREVPLDYIEKKRKTRSDKGSTRSLVMLGEDKDENVTTD